MRLPFFRAKDPAEPAHQPRRGRAPKPVDEGPVHAARVQARRRLIGALVLLAAGITGFPILFETQPRPLPVDTPMLLTDPHGSRVASAPTSRPRPVLPADAGTEFVPAVTPAPTPMSAVVPAALAAASTAASTPTAVLASAPAAAPLKVAPMTAAASSAAPPPAAVRAELAKPAPKPVAEAEADARPGPAIQSAPETTPAAAGRFVVQVGAYNDAERLKVARQKVEKLGFKSYTQDVDTTTGKRTRVRVGPFATRQEAEAVAVRVKGAGLQANILVL